MLLNRTEQLINELDSFEALQLSSNESKVYIERNGELKAILVYVNKLTEIICLFRKQNFVIEIDSIINYPSELFKTLYKNWETDKKNIIQKNDFFRRVKWDEIEYEINSILKKEWEKHIDEKKPNINVEALNAFEQIPDLSSVTKNLKDKLVLLEEYKKRLPIDEHDFQLVLSSSLEMQQLTNQLKSSNLPDAVSNFLNKAGNEGITLSEITTEIIDWLKENNLIHLCQVKFRK